MYYITTCQASINVNKMEEFNQTIVASLTVGQLLSILKSFLGKNEATEDAPASMNYVYGLRGIQDLFQCSHTQAQRYKDGLLKPAVIQSGRKIMVDVDTAIKLFNQNREGFNEGGKNE